MNLKYIFRLTVLLLVGMYKICVDGINCLFAIIIEVEAIEHTFINCLYS